MDFAKNINMKLKINILVIIGLNQSKALTYILPILKTLKINKLYLIRDSPLLLNDERIININPPKRFRKNLLIKSIYKLFSLIVLNLRYKFNLIYSIHMFPQGVFGWFISKLFKIKYVFHLIGFFNDSIKEKISRYGNFFTFISVKAILNANYLMIEGFFDQINSKNKLPLFLKQIKIDFHKILPGYTSVFPEKFFPIEKEKKWDIITIGRLDQIKRIDIFIKIVQNLLDIIDLNCAIIGDGPLLAELKIQVENEGLRNKICFLGRISDNKLNHYYNSAKIFLLTSENEGLPATIVEAMLTKTCPISTDVGLIPNLIKNGYNGFLYSINNLKNAEKIILKCLKNDNLRKIIGNNCRKRAIEVTAWNRVSSWNKIIRSI